MGPKAHQLRVVHAWWIDDALWAEQVDRVEVVFDLAKGLVDLWAKLPFNPLAPAQAVAMLAAVGALVFAYQRGCFFSNGPHLGCAPICPTLAHVQNGTNMQRTDRGVRVPGAFAAVFFEHLGQPVCVVGQVLQRHRAVFNKADRFAVTFEAHHDVQTGLAHFPQVFLRRVVNHFNHRTGQAEVAHQLHQLFDFRHQICFG